MWAAAWTPRARIGRSARVSGSLSEIAIVSRRTMALSRSQTCSRIDRALNVPRIDSVIANSARWLTSCRSNLPDCARRRAAVSAFAIAWAARLA